MVPGSYHSFFSGAVSAAAALIGLLFVAISVAPHKLSGEQAEASFRVKAGMAFSVLISALVISLYGLLPGESLATAGVVVGIAGLSSTAGLALLAARNAELRARRLLVGTRLLALAAVYVVVLVEALALDSKPHSSGPVEVLCTLVVVCLLIGIDRAWELLGAVRTGLIKLMLRALHDRQPQRPSSEAPDFAETADREQR